MNVPFFGDGLHVQKIEERRKDIMDYVKAFVVGGIICAIVPLLGFGNVLWKGVKEAVDSEGFIGLFKGGFKACAVGVSAALIFSYIAALITKPKLKS